MKSRLRKGLLLLAVLALTMAVTPVVGAQPETTLEEDIEAAIVRGLAWMAAQQNDNGSFGEDPPTPIQSSIDATTGLAILKFEDRARELGYDPLDPDYEYSDVVKKGLGYLKERVQTPVPPAPELPAPPGRYWGQDPLDRYWVYSTGIVMMALAASQHPETYGDLLQDALDWMEWAQADPGCGTPPYPHGGGWRYIPNGCNSDNSVSGYATLGLGFAQAPPPYGFGLSVDQAVLDALDVWIDVMQDPVDGDEDDGGSWYYWTVAVVNILKTGNLLYEMGLVGDTADTPRVEDAVDYIERQWDNDTLFNPGWRRTTQATFAMMKGLTSLGIEYLDLDGGGVADDKWFPIVAQHLIDTQIKVGPEDELGYWRRDLYDYHQPYVLSTAWALLSLEKAVPTFETPVSVDVKPASCPNAFNVGHTGVTPVAVLGTGDFDVTQVDPASVMLEGVAPLRWAYEDVATPYEPYMGKEDPYDCTTEGADGYLDLTLKYGSQEVAAALGGVADGDVVVVTLTGNLMEEYGGTPIIGEDVIVILHKE